MCFSFEVSLGTGLMSWAIVFYLLLTKDISLQQKQQLIFLLIFSSMQYADALLWHIKMKKNKINYIVTSIIIPLILSLQLIYNVYFINKINNIYVNILIGLFVIYWFWKLNGYSVSSCNKKLDSPIWGNNEITLIELIIFTTIIAYPYLGFAFIVPLIVLFVGGGYGSMYCALANIMAIYYLLTF